MACVLLARVKEALAVQMAEAGVRVPLSTNSNPPAQDSRGGNGWETPTRDAEAADTRHRCSGLVSGIARRDLDGCIRYVGPSCDRVPDPIHRVGARCKAIYEGMAKLGEPLTPMDVLPLHIERHSMHMAKRVRIRKSSCLQPFKLRATCGSLLPRLSSLLPRLAIQNLDFRCPSWRTMASHDRSRRS